MSQLLGKATDARIVAATDLPVIADADIDYGNPINIIQAVRAYEQAGIAGLHIEDQASPKRCGHIEGKMVVPATRFEAKGPLGQKLTRSYSRLCFTHGDREIR